MEKLHFSTMIDAPIQKVWDTMLQNETYRIWTDIFNPDSGSYFEGDWSEGSTMKFLGPEEDGTRSGMYSMIEANRAPEFLSIKHIGEIKHGVEQPWPVMEGQNFHENYSLKEVDGKTQVDIDLDSNEEFKAMFEGLWPKALVKLKELAEAN